MENSQEPIDLQQLVILFAVSLQNAIGLEETTLLLAKLTKFATECPDALVDLKSLVESNPKVFKDLLTRQGVTEAKEMISQVSLYLPMLAAFK